eukprot:g57455.t1
MDKAAGLVPLCAVEGTKYLSQEHEGCAWVYIVKETTVDRGTIMVPFVLRCKNPDEAQKWEGEVRRLVASQPTNIRSLYDLSGQFWKRPHELFLQRERFIGTDRNDRSKQIEQIKLGVMPTAGTQMLPTVFKAGDLPYPVLRDTLQKKTGTKFLWRSIWQRRFFLLTESILFYFMSQGGAICGAIPLSRIKAVYCVPRTDLRLDVYIQHPQMQKMLCLRADTTEQRAKWVETMNKYIDITMQKFQMRPKELETYHQEAKIVAQEAQIRNLQKARLMLLAEEPLTDKEMERHYVYNPNPWLKDGGEGDDEDDEHDSKANSLPSSAGSSRAGSTASLNPQAAKMASEAFAKDMEMSSLRNSVGRLVPRTSNQGENTALTVQKPLNGGPVRGSLNVRPSSRPSTNVVATSVAFPQGSSLMAIEEKRRQQEQKKRQDMLEKQMKWSEKLGAVAKSTIGNRLSVMQGQEAGIFLDGMTPKRLSTIISANQPHVFKESPGQKTNRLSAMQAVRKKSQINGSNNSPDKQNGQSEPDGPPALESTVTGDALVKTLSRAQEILAAPAEVKRSKQNSEVESPTWTPAPKSRTFRGPSVDLDLSTTPGPADVSQRPSPSPNASPKTFYGRLENPSPVDPIFEGNMDLSGLNISQSERVSGDVDKV